MRNIRNILGIVIGAASVFVLGYGIFDNFFLAGGLGIFTWLVEVLLGIACSECCKYLKSPYGKYLSNITIILVLIRIVGRIFFH